MEVLVIFIFWLCAEAYMWFVSRKIEKEEELKDKQAQAVMAAIERDRKHYHLANRKSNIEYMPK